MKYGVLFWKRGKWDNCAKLSLMTLTKGKQDVDSGVCVKQCNYLSFDIVLLVLRKWPV